MDNPKVSVLMPAYNSKDYIAEAINSVLRQTLEDFELIIIDDCSTDGTEKIISEFVARDNRIIFRRNAENRGIPYCRNELLRLAKGKYIAWQDADDISLPWRLEHQYDFLENNPAVGIVGGFLEIINEDGATVSMRKYFPDDSSLRERIFRYSPIAQPAAMIRKICFQKTGGYDSKYRRAQDLDMSFRIGEFYKFANLQETLIKYRQVIDRDFSKKIRLTEFNTIDIKKRYGRGHGYRMIFPDRIYNFLHRLSMFLMPSKFKVWIFNVVRDNKFRYAGKK